MARDAPNFLREVVVLARANRLVSGEEFRLTSRRGRRVQTSHLAVTSLVTGSTMPARFGFTMTKKIGNAVVRNRLRRQLRAIAWQLVREGTTGVDVVVRGLPGSAKADWDSLHSEFAGAIRQEREVAR